MIWLHFMLDRLWITYTITGMQIETVPLFFFDPYHLESYFIILYYYFLGIFVIQKLIQIDYSLTLVAYCGWQVVLVIYCPVLLLGRQVSGCEGEAGWLVLHLQMVCLGVYLKLLVAGFKHVLCLQCVGVWRQSKRDEVYRYAQNSKRSV